VQVDIAALLFFCGLVAKTRDVIAQALTLGN